MTIFEPIRHQIWQLWGSLEPGGQVEFIDDPTLTWHRPQPLILAHFETDGSENMSMFGFPNRKFSSFCQINSDENSDETRMFELICTIRNQPNILGMAYMLNRLIYS